MTRWAQSALAVVVCFAAVSCNVSRLFAGPSGESFTIAGGQPLATAYQLGDTVTFVASEYCDSSVWADCKQPPTSTASPSTYHWSSSNNAIAMVVQRGRVQMVSLGRALIYVSTVHSSGMFTVQVVPRVSAIRITPTTASIALGDSALAEISVVDSLGAVVPGITGFTFFSVQQADNLSNPVARAFTRDTAHFIVKGLRSGTQTFSARLSVLNAPKSADTMTVVVK